MFTSVNPDRLFTATFMKIILGCCAYERLIMKYLFIANLARVLFADAGMFGD